MDLVKAIVSFNQGTVRVTLPVDLQALQSISTIFLLNNKVYIEFVDSGRRINT